MQHHSITTGKGDQGETRALDGSTLPKDHAMMEALGALETLRAHLALLQIRLQPIAEEKESTECLFFLLHACFALGAYISDPESADPESPHALTPQHLERLEQEQHRLETELNLPGAFIAAASNEDAALADLAVAAARSFERRLVGYQRIAPGFNAPLPLAFANRMSDFLFILARHLEKGVYHTVDYSRLNPS